MKNSIDFNQMRLLEEQIRKQTAVLQLLLEELDQIEKRIHEMSYMDSVKREIIMSRESLTENIRVLSAMDKVICEALQFYRQTEDRICDRYNLDTVFYPETIFGVSRITGLEKCKFLIQF